MLNPNLNPDQGENDLNHDKALQPGCLYVVGTPIGNLEDISFRALRVLKQADWIAAEDTRHTGKLLQYFQIKTPQLSYHHHNRHSRIPELLERLQQQQTLALVSDAGMPGIADPGYELIQACIAAGIRVIPIPGSCAAITALSAAGQMTDRFVFEGFLPTKNSERQHRLQVIATALHTIILYEAPHRLCQTLAELSEVLEPERSLTLCRELTKHFEEFWRGTLAEAVAHYQTHEPRGEFTLVIAGASVKPITYAESDLKAALQELLAEGLSRSQASRKLAQTTQLPRQQLYQLSLSLEHL
jgi:16S rRNA (cytidine1402-2'-O)-methyltransferase